MYAIVLDRCHQYRAEVGTRITVDRRADEVGASVELPLLLIADGDAVQVGTPVLAGKKAVCTVVAHRRGRKGIAAFYKRRKNERRRIGFRRELTDLQVVSIG